MGERGPHTTGPRSTPLLRARATGAAAAGWKGRSTTHTSSTNAVHDRGARPTTRPLPTVRTRPVRNAQRTPMAWCGRASGGPGVLTAGSARTSRSDPADGAAPGVPYQHLAGFVWTIAETRFPPVGGGVTPLSTRPQP